MAEREPLAVVLVGSIAVGKTTLAERLADELPAVLVSTDRVRGELFERPDYTANGDRAVYDTVIDRAADAVRGGRHLVCDGTNLESAWREQLEDAIGEAAEVVYVVLFAPDEVMRERLGRRDARIPPSIGLHRDWWHVYDDLRSRLDPLSRPHLLVDSTQPYDSVTRLLRRLAAGSTHPVPKGADDE